MNERPRRTHRLDARDQSGSTLVLVTSFVLTLFGFAALAIDVARVYKERAHEQFGTDAAAFAAVSLLTNASSGTAKTAAIQEATDVTGANGVTSSEISNGGSIQVGQWSNSTFTADATPYNAVRVPAKRTVDMTFAKVVGQTSMRPGAHSIADLESAGRAANIIPFAVSASELTNHTFGDLYTLNDATIASGKQGKIDLGVDEAPNYANYQNVGAWQADMTPNGCNCTVSVGSIPIVTGNAQVEQTFNGIANGTILAMPVVDQSSFSGNSGMGNIVGFVLVQMVSSSGNGNGWSATVQFLNQITGDGGGGGCPPPCVQARVLVQ